MTSRPAAGGGRWVEVDPARVARWVEGFADRHGPPTTTPQEYGLLLAAPDGATAELHGPPGVPPVVDLAGFVTAVAAPRRIGLLLARKGAVAVGIAEGGDLVVSKVDTRYVQGRTAAGGWSQQRFARRRDNQARAALGDAAELAVRLLLPAAATLTALVGGGDRRAVDTVLADRRLAPLAALRADRLLDVPEPRHAVLVAAVDAARAVRVLVRDPGPAAP
ncbi:peptide chain release factor 1 [Micromonospora sp. MW-13]|uniref:acVLRF1 family peptidyl-tRNA hydrolase n=1 Tax=unclassified Micromonospora TaxID=2617518 RepID=UPI000E43B6A8|nr:MULTISPECIES: acVLRF1 family peptidyl-tRNA hydrolase [unclassified Micromonospora]MCX4471158.1 acVLRF1 family peptidyl-tRNA hydrolase [Micromonospora sp. NBC_01655]RGC67119.1 peptide chain release factor 1 [Micromonospora sp. MW-13]